MKLDSELLLSLANISYLAGTLLLTRKVIQNRNSLSDYDFHGSFINTVGMILAAAALISLRFYITLVISIPTLLFWAIVAIFSSKNRNRSKRWPKA